MSSFTYRPFYRLIYRFGNLLLTPIFLIYMLPAILMFRYEIGQFAYIIVFSVIIVYVNMLYFRLYKILPFRIEIDDEKIICCQFFRKDKTITLSFSGIVKLQGGIFYGKSKGLMQIEGDNSVIGFFHHLTNANIFIAALLQNVPPEVYKQIEPQLKSRLYK